MAVQADPASRIVPAGRELRRGKETRKAILNVLREDPTATYREIAWRVGRAIDSTWHSVQLLKRKGLIREVRCSECGGKRWEVLES